MLHQDVPDKLPPGDVLVVDPRQSCDAFEVGEPIADPIITEQDKLSPLMTHIRLDNVLMPEARRLKFAAPPQVLAGALSGDAVYVAARRAGGKCLVLSVDINQGDLAFCTAFPIMAANAIGWFNGQTGELRPSLTTGSTAEIDLAGDHGGGDALVLRSPSGSSQRLTLRHRASPQTQDGGNAAPGAAPAEAVPYLSTPPLGEHGLWRVVVEGTGGVSAPVTQVAVNLADESESDLRTPSELLLREPNARLAQWFNRPIWF